MTVQHAQMLLQIESLANNIAQACTALNNILAAGTQFDREADPTSIAQARTTMEALQGALICLPSLEAGLLTLEAQLSRQDDSQEPFAFRSRLIDRLQSTMFMYQTRIELAEPIGSSRTRPTSKEMSLSVTLCGKIQQALDTIKVRKLDLLKDRAKLRRLHNRWLDPHPISQLPSELLSHVFLLAENARPDFKQHSSDSLCLTPRIFRRGILPAPTSEVAELRFAGLPLGWLDQEGCHFIFIVTLDHPHRPSDIAKIIIPHLQRVKDIQILIQSLTGIEFLSRLARASDPNTAYQLSVLKVHSSRPLEPEIRFGERERALFSQLDLLVLSGVGISGWPEWQVEKACIYFTEDDHEIIMTWNTMLGPLFWGLPLLKELNVGITFDLEYETPANDVPPAIATFPSLSGMKIHTTFQNLERLLAIMEAPKLDSLEIRCYNPFDGHVDISVSIANFVRRHTVLQQLTLVNSDDVSDGNLVAAMESFPYAPSLERLTLIGGYGSADDLLTRVRSVLQNLPSLKLLRLDRMYISLGLLKSFMLATRQPLSVYLGGCFVTVPSHENYPDANPETLASLVEADMETLARESSNRDVTLTWSEISFCLEIYAPV